MSRLSSGLRDYARTRAQGGGILSALGKLVREALGTEKSRSSVACSLRLNFVTALALLGSLVAAAPPAASVTIKPRILCEDPDSGGGNSPALELCHRTETVSALAYERLLQEGFGRTHAGAPPPDQLIATIMDAQVASPDGPTSNFRVMLPVPVADAVMQCVATNFNVDFIPWGRSIKMQAALSSAAAIIIPEARVQGPCPTFVSSTNPFIPLPPQTGLCVSINESNTPAKRFEAMERLEQHWGNRRKQPVEVSVRGDAAGAARILARTAPPVRGVPLAVEEVGRACTPSLEVVRCLLNGGTPSVSTRRYGGPPTPILCVP